MNERERNHDRDDMDEQEEKYRHLCEAVFEGIYVHDNGVILYANEILARMSGYTVQELIGMRDIDLAVPECREILSQNTESAYEKPYEVLGLRKDGSTISVEIQGKTVLHDGTYYRVTSVRDVTERKAWEQALRGSEGKYRTLFEAASDGVTLYKNGRLIESNQKAVDLFGLPLDRIIGNTPWDLSPPTQPDGQSSKEKALDYLNKASSGAPQIFEWVHLNRNNKRFDVEVNLSVIEIEDGPVILAIIRDITDRKRVEAELRQSELRYRSIVEDQTEFIVRWLPGGIRTFVNGSYCRHIGLSYDEAIGTSFFPLKSVEDREKIQQKIASLTPENPEATTEHRILYPDGSVGWDLWTDRAIFDNNGELLEYQSIGHDITTRKQAEEEVRKLNEELEQRVKERTTELSEAQQQLVNQERMAALGQLTAVVSHELRNPLGTIRNSFMTLIEKVRGKEQGLERILDRIDRNIERCTNIIEELLDFTRGHEPILEPTPLEDWLTGILEGYTVPAGIELQHNLTTGCRIMIDRNRFHRCVINLLDNACQAIVGTEAPETFPHTITIRSRQDGNRVEIRISDTGPGIPEEAFAQIFEPLYSTKSFGGGLGLPIVRQIIEQHGGGIELKNNPEHGATALFWLPLSSGDTFKELV